MNLKESLDSIVVVINVKKYNLTLEKRGILNGYHASVCMNGCKPHHYL